LGLRPSGTYNACAWSRRIFGLETALRPGYAIGICRPASPQFLWRFVKGFFTATEKAQ